MANVVHYLKANPPVNNLSSFQLQWLVQKTATQYYSCQVSPQLTPAHITKRKLYLIVLYEVIRKKVAIRKCTNPFEKNIKKKQEKRNVKFDL